MQGHGEPKGRAGTAGPSSRSPRVSVAGAGSPPLAPAGGRAASRNGGKETSASRRATAVPTTPAPTAASSKPRRRPPSPAAIRSISHDIRNLLTAVRGHAELALRGLGADDPVREDVAHVLVVTASVFEMVDLLDGAPASDARLSTDLDLTVSGMRRLLDALLPDHVVLEIATGSDRSRVPLSRLRIERIVLNLAMNARDAMADGGTVTVSTRRHGEDRAELTVSDSGPGFTEDALAHLFVEGFTTKGDRGGSGRGLAAIHHIVTDAGGSIHVESVAGTGATVVVRLPFAEPIAI